MLRIAAVPQWGTSPALQRRAVRQVQKFAQTHGLGQSTIRGNAKVVLLAPKAAPGVVSYASVLR